MMSSKRIRADANFAWPNAEIAVMGAEAPVNILYRRELENAGDVDAVRAARARCRRILARYRGATGFIDEVIVPRQTRRKLIAALEALDTKRDRNPPKKHGNIPL